MLHGDGVHDRHTLFRKRGHKYGHRSRTERDNQRKLLREGPNIKGTGRKGLRQTN